MSLPDNFLESLLSSCVFRVDHQGSFVHVLRFLKLCLRQLFIYTAEAQVGVQVLIVELDALNVVLDGTFVVTDVVECTRQVEVALWRLLIYV